MCMCIMPVLSKVQILKKKLVLSCLKLHFSFSQQRKKGKGCTKNLHKWKTEQYKF